MKTFQETVALMFAHRATLTAEDIALQRLQGSLHAPVWERASKTSTRFGDWDVTLESGNMYIVKCRRCSITGRIPLPENRPERSRCPRCARTPAEDWQQLGFGSLLPKEVHAKKLLPASIDADDELEIPSSDDITELPTYTPSVIAAGIDSVEPADELAEEAELQDEEGQSEQGGEVGAE